MTRENTNISWVESDVFYIKAAELIKPARSILDIGCGIRPQQFIVPAFLICVEPYFEYAEMLKENFAGTNTVIIQLEAKQALLSLPDKSIETIFLLDVIEHISKETGQDIIKECERVARCQIVIFTPLGYMPQEVHADKLDAWNLHGGSWQEHKSGWYPEDFPDWEIIACKHLHKYNSKGEELNPPYGGFYAIKSLPKSANYFNDIYAQEILRSNTNSIKELNNSFPLFTEQVVNNEIGKSNLKTAIWSSQRTTELFIETGMSKSPEEILKLAENEKIAICLKEAEDFIVKINQIAAEFKAINSNETELFAELANCRDQITNLREENSNLQVEISRLKEEVSNLQIEISRLQEEVAKNIWSRIYRKIKKLLI